MKDITYDLICYLISGFHASLKITSIETLAVYLMLFICCSFMILSRLLSSKLFIFMMNSVAVLFAICLVSIAPSIQSETSFDAASYESHHFDFDSLSSIPKFPPLLLKNSTLSTKGPWFVDSEERILLVRGVNLVTKLPSTPDGSTWLNESLGFWENQGDVSFVNRPFSLDEADEHFGRLRAWGLTFIRLLITWEAVEHAGPGIYDEEYLDYLVKLVRKAAEYGINVFIDPHQDVWSRWSGGDGAPYWTLEAAGFDITRLDSAGAALTHQGHGNPLPPMIWGTNNWRLATATMFTLFFAGNQYAAGVNAFGEDEPIQDFLQRHFLEAMTKVALILRDEKNVIGFDTLNEPNSGWIGRKDLSSRSDGLSFRWGLDLSPFEQMKIASGFGSVNASMYNPPFVKLRDEIVNPNNLSAWGPLGCVWRRSGVWDVTDGIPILLRPDHFELRSGQSLIDDFMVPLWTRLRNRIRALNQHQRLLVFAEPPIDFSDPNSHKIPTLPDKTNEWVYAPHWYEIVGLISKSYCAWLGIAQWQSPVWEELTGSPILGPVIGNENLVEGYTTALAHLVYTGDRMGGPTLIGETGIAMDMVRKTAFHSGDWANHIAALDNVMTALDNNLLSFTLWNYCSDNDNVHGDQWNDEDLSLFSRSQLSHNRHKHDPYAGGRALPAAVRPYARKVSATPVSMRFDLERRFFSLAVKRPRPQHPTEIFVPLLHYPKGILVTTTAGHYDYDPSQQILLWWHQVETDTRPHILTIADVRLK